MPDLACHVNLLNRIDCAGDELDFDGDVVADEGGVVLAAVVDAEVAAVQDCFGGIADAEFVGGGVFGCPSDGEWERDLFGHTVHRQWSMSDKLLSLLLDSLALECDFRKLFHVEEVSISEMSITPFYSRVYTGGLDHHAD